MTTVALSTTPATLDPGTAYEILVVNSGAVSAHVQINGGLLYDERVKPGQSVRVPTSGNAVTAYVRSGTGQVDVTITAATNPQGAPSHESGQLDAATARGTYAQRAANRLATLKTAVYPVPTVSAAPTFTVPAGVVHTTSGTTGSTLTNPVNYPYNTSGKWRLLGIVPGVSGNYYGNGMLRGAALAGTRFMPPYRVEFMHSGQTLEFALRYVSTTGSWRVKVNDQWANAEVTTGNDGNRYLIKMDFGSREVRKITLHLHLCYFGGLNIAGTDSVFQAPAPDTRVLILSDSYGEGVGGLGATAAWPQYMSDALGLNDLWQAAESSTGYVALSSTVTGTQTFLQRAQSVIPQMGGVPDIVVIFGGYNDNPTNPTGAVTYAQAATAALATFQGIRALAPMCDLFVIGVQQTNGTESSQTQAVRDAVINAGSAVTAFFDTKTAADPWITGTGRVGATTGDGNADINIAGDGIHPWSEGHKYYGLRIVRAIRDYYYGRVRSLA